jgi:bifunctional UDP-N-acetylglucosamine pyrophosphorylase/glucosamine-1-phosphate N-acetyltransferase
MQDILLKDTFYRKKEFLMSDQSMLFLVILAAGKGTRMKSEKAKVLHHVFYAPMLHHVLTAVKPLRADKTIAIIGHQRSDVERSLAGFDVVPCVQEEQLGTGHAVLCAEQIIGSKKGTVMILCGDTPLIQTETLKEMYAQHLAHGGPLTIMTTLLENSTNYGRIITNNVGKVLSIIEEKDASPEQKKIREINAGIYCVDVDFLFPILKMIGTNNSQGEVYLTDIVLIATEQKHPVEKHLTSRPLDVLGVNSRIELAEAHKELQMRRNRQLMLEGVTMHDPATISIAPEVKMSRDVILYPGVHITGHSVIGENCTLKTGAFLKDSILGENVSIGAYSYLERCAIEAGKDVGPHSVLSS